MIVERRNNPPKEGPPLNSQFSFSLLTPVTAEILATHFRITETKEQESVKPKTENRRRQAL
jgi:hypothetical protein